MAELTKKEQYKLLFQILYTLDTIYADYAKSVGLSYSTLIILNFIYETPENCTQKLLSEKTFLPKQTVNTVITGLYKDGLVSLKEKQDDRRNKNIHLTSKGQAFADKIFLKLDNAAIHAFDEIDAAESSKLLELMRTYVEKLQDNIQSEKAYEDN